MEIKELVNAAHENAVAHGWWDNKPEIGTLIALIHSELSEALEEERAGRPHIWYECKEDYPMDGAICNPKDKYDCLNYDMKSKCPYRSSKPEGISIELADAVIRIADLCGAYGIDLDAAIEEKMAYNKTRPYKHGKKF